MATGDFKEDQVVKTGERIFFFSKTQSFSPEDIWITSQKYWIL